MIMDWFLLFVSILCVSILSGFIIYAVAKKDGGNRLSIYCRNYVQVVAAAVILISIIYPVLVNHGTKVGPEMMKIFAILSVTALSVMVIINLSREIAFPLVNDSQLSADIASEITATTDNTVNFLGFKIKIPGNLQLFLSIAMIALTSRMIIYFIGYLYTLLVLNQQQDLFASFVSLWFKWDSEHYLEIAQNGYRSVGDKAHIICFYPLYPSFIRLFARITGNYLWAAVMVSNLALITAGYYLYQLTRLDFDEDTSHRAVKYMLIYPFSFFLGLPYTESLFLALTLMTLYYLRKKEWLIAGTCGCLAALTKNQGVLLLIPAGIEYLLSNNPVATFRQQNYPAAFKSFFIRGLALLLIPMGILVYLFINKMILGDWFGFLEYQENFYHQRLGFFANTIYGITESALNLQDQFRFTYTIPALISFLVVVLVLFYSFHKIRLSYLAYALVYLVVSFSPTWLLSGSRYISSLAPLFLIFAVFSKDRSTDTILTFCSTCLLGAYTLAFLTGRVL